MKFTHCSQQMKLLPSGLAFLVLPFWCRVCIFQVWWLEWKREGLLYCSSYQQLMSLLTRLAVTFYQPHWFCTAEQGRVCFSLISCCTSGAAIRELYLGSNNIYIVLTQWGLFTLMVTCHMAGRSRVSSDTAQGFKGRHVCETVSISEDQSNILSRTVSIIGYGQCHNIPSW